MSKRILGFSPLPVNLVLAACHRNHWDMVRIVSRKLISGELSRYANMAEVSEVILFLDGVEKMGETRTALQRLARKKVALTWVTARASPAVREVCQGIPGVTLRENLGQEDFLKAEGNLHAGGKALFEALRDPTGDLSDYLRYKLTLMLIQGLDLTSVEEAIQQLVTFRKGGGFRSGSLPAADQVSLAQFRAGDYPILEGYSPPILDLKRQLAKAGGCDRSVLILGSTGTGKEAVAFFLHEFSKRRGKPYMAINCAGFKKDLLLAELFGYVKGAFTGADRDSPGLLKGLDGGTLFLDEVGDMAPRVQAALLRFLETKTYRPLMGKTELHADVRIISAGQPSLRKRMERGKFRPDLFYRLARVELETPDLASIRADIPRIIRQLLYKEFHASEDTDLIHRHFERVIREYQANQEVLDQYSWPGNVRELAALVHRIIDFDDHAFDKLAHRLRTGEAPGVSKLTDLFGNIPPGTFFPANEVKPMFIRAIAEKNPDIPRTELATRLGISFNTLHGAISGTVGRHGKE